MSDKGAANAGKKVDLRIRRTLGAIREAFVSLMQKKAFSAITVTDISEMAGINRKTFYAHYETKDQLLGCMIEEMFSDLIGTLMYDKQSVPEQESPYSLTRDLTCFFEKVEGYREMIDALITPQTSAVAFSIADAVIYANLASTDAAEGIRSEIIVSRIKNFFLTAIDWWMEQTDCTPQQAGRMYGNMMRMSLSDVFGYRDI